MAKRGEGESNTGLIVSLVFFVLATIGLGVGTYMGYAGKAEAEKQAKSATDAKNAAEKKAREEETMRLTLRLAAGLDDQADRQTFAGRKNEFQPQVESILNAFYTGLQNKLGLKDLPRWTPFGPSATDVPPKSFLALADEFIKRETTALSREKQKEDELAKALETYKTSLEDTQNKLKTAQDSLKKANEAVVNEQGKRAAGSDDTSKKIKDLSEQVQQLTLEKQNLEVDKDRQIKKLQEDLDTRKKVREQFQARVGPIMDKLDQIQQQRPELREISELHDLLSRQFEAVNSIANDTPKGSVVRVTPNQLYINLGSADYVRPGLTFSVLPAGSTGRSAAVRERKGALEIVSVVEPHLSVAKIIEANNPTRDPFLPGDLLFNPAWNPSQREHVALAGIIDINGDGVDDTQDLIRALERQGVIVDAWLDMKDRAIKGPGITEKTTYLILGERPVMSSSMPVENNPIMAAATEVLGKMSEMETKARDLGVQRVAYRRFLSLIGYKLPKLTQPQDFSASSYLKGITTKSAEPKEEKPK